MAEQIFLQYTTNTCVIRIILRLKHLLKCQIRKIAMFFKKKFFLYVEVKIIALN